MPSTPPVPATLPGGRGGHFGRRSCHQRCQKILQPGCMVGSDWEEVIFFHSCRRFQVQGSVGHRPLACLCTWDLQSLYFHAYVEPDGILWNLKVCMPSFKSGMCSDTSSIIKFGKCFGQCSDAKQTTGQHTEQRHTSRLPRNTQNKGTEADHRTKPQK